jgi:predicted alpha/beta-hydrolase family hydrolase
MTKEKLKIDDKVGEISYLISAPSATTRTLILAHGAGAGMEHSFMNHVANALAEKNIRVIRFNFPYKERGRKMPGSPKEAILAYKVFIQNMLERFPSEPMILSGKSYGGRMASHVVAENPQLPLSGIVYFGFPLHAPGKPSMNRADHLTEIDIPQLFLQGTNDALANIDLIEKVVKNQNKGELIRFEGADHSFKTPKTSPLSTSDVFTKLIAKTVEWMSHLH